jgi:hypothetical protein
VNLTPQEKIDALRELTKGPDDVFAARSNDVWRPVYTSLRDHVLRMHLAGAMEIGSYPLMPAGDWPTCYWVGADFDGKEVPDSVWQRDVSRAAEFFTDLDGCPCVINLSRSGQGAHIRMLFREPVPAWLARRWMNFWLEEAGILESVEDEWAMPLENTFDRLIPPQDQLSGGVNRNGYRLPGNLMGSPLHGRLAKLHGGTLPLNPREVERGNFEPDGKHWEHVMSALEGRGWGEAELRQALADCPDDTISLDPPSYGGWHGSAGANRSLPILPAGEAKLDFTIKFCAFMQKMAEPGDQPYALWVALASQLHRFGDAGLEAFHHLSGQDSRYNARDAERKWEQTSRMSPMRCSTLVGMGYCCPHLRTPRCNGAGSPALFVEGTDAEIL